MAQMEIILNENIPALGAEADIVKVRAGYARNYLIPQGLAFETNPATLRQIERLKAKRAEREAKELNEAEELARRLGKMKVIFTLNTGSQGKAFGSISLNDLVERLTVELGGGKTIEKHRILLERPIKETGEFEVPIKVHADVLAKLKIVVKAEVAPEPVQAEEEPEEEGDRPRRRRA